VTPASAHRDNALAARNSPGIGCDPAEYAGGFEIFLGKNEGGLPFWKDSEAVRRWLGWKAWILSSGTDNSPGGGAAQALGDLGDRTFKIKNGE